MAEGGEPLAILAAGGMVPFQVASAAVAAGRPVFVIGLEGTSDDRLKTFPHEMVKLGQLGRIEALLAAHGGRDVVLIGDVKGRPDFSTIGVDFGALRILPRILSLLKGGDDSLLSGLVKLIEDYGYRVVGAHEVAPDLVASAGLIAGPRNSAAVNDDARIALHAARAVGRLDVGQGTVAVGGRVVAVEGAEGTDAMLQRVAELRRSGRVKWSGRSGVLAKCPKPQQDLRIDMPTIGPRTVEGVAAAQLAGIVIEAGRVMIAERDETQALAERTRTFIRAIEPESGEAG
jgi:UDP-2,3-diacylglucosamine hydrolase